VRDAAVFARAEEAVGAGVVVEIVDPQLDAQRGFIRGDRRERLERHAAAEGRTAVERDDRVVDMLREIGRKRLERGVEDELGIESVGGEGHGFSPPDFQRPRK
jgi:hypothetical protein